jgi:hypothetical protein
MVTYRHEESARLAKDMPAQDITLAKDATLTGGLCLGAAEPKSHDIVVEHAAPARDPATWQALLEQALSGLNGQVRPSTSAAAPGVLAYVEHHRGAHPSPAFFPVPHAWVKAVCGPMAPTQRAAAPAASAAHERRAPVPGQRQGAGDVPAKQGAGHAPQATTSQEQRAQDAPGARQECARISAQRAPVAQRSRRIGQADPCVDVERGVRRNGRRMAAAIRAPLDTMRTVALHEGLSQPCLDRLEQAARVVPQMPATIACVSGSVRAQVRQLDLPPPLSYALHAHLMPSFSRERVAQTRTVSAGESLRARAAPVRSALCESGGACAAWRETEHSPRNQQAKERAEVCQRSRANVEGRNGSLSLRPHHLRG